jgi:glycerate kinase
MRVLVCPDKFAGTLDAPGVAAAIVAGWLSRAPADEVVTLPLSDGGPGFLAVLADALGREPTELPTFDPLGRPVTGQVLRRADTAYLESAQACGLHLLAPGERDPKRTTSYGLGVLVAATIETGVREIVIGLGGSGTNDGGAGMLAALGAAPLDTAGYALPYGGAALLGCAGLGGVPRLRGVRLVAATDVDSPLWGPTGASCRFGPQKGAGPDDIALLDAALARFAEVLSNLDTAPPDLAARPGAGAAGGLGAAIFALGGRVESGIELVRRAVGLDQRLEGCDLVITGEGSFDEQSLAGKVVAGVAAAARARAVPCAVLAGRASVTSEAAGVTEVHSLIDHFGGDLATALARPAEGLHGLAAQLASRAHGR